MKSRNLFVSIATAALLWFWMFSPWTSGITNFWLTMSVAAIVLTGLALYNTSGRLIRFGKSVQNPVCGNPLFHIFPGIGIAFALWGIFWIGDKLSSLMFDFARPEVDAVYSMKEGFPSWVIALLLLLVIGPAEELFWRGYVQRTMETVVGKWRFPKDCAFLITTVVYALVHIWSFNFMLVMAALVAGAVWGFIYRLKPSLLPALVVSHAVWDALVFVILPI